MELYKVYGVFDEKNKCICGVSACSGSEAVRLLVEYLSNEDPETSYYCRGRKIKSSKSGKNYLVKVISC